MWWTGLNVVAVDRCKLRVNVVAVDRCKLRVECGGRGQV